MQLTRLTAAYRIAAEAHARQLRRGQAGVVYVDHPCEVADLVARDGGTESDVIAALLHYLVNEEALGLDEIERQFGAEVAALTTGLVRDPRWADLDLKARKAAQAEHLERQPAAVKRIKIADQTCNLRDLARDPQAWDVARARAYVAGATRVVAAIREASPTLAAKFDDARDRALAALAGSMDASAEDRE